MYKAIPREQQFSSRILFLLLLKTDWWGYGGEFLHPHTKNGSWRNPYKQETYPSWFSFIQYSIQTIFFLLPFLSWNERKEKQPWNGARWNDWIVYIHVSKCCLVQKSIDSGKRTFFYFFVVNFFSFNALAGENKRNASQRGEKNIEKRNKFIWQIPLAFFCCFFSFLFLMNGITVEWMNE